MSLPEPNDPCLAQGLPDTADWHARTLRQMAQGGDGYLSQNDILRLNRAADYLERRDVNDPVQSGEA